MNRLRLCLAFGLLAAASASAQDVSTLFQFRILNPGARSLGFGGAFAALADDATAAYANPAGLVQLLRPELSFEIRATGVEEIEGSFSSQEFSGVGFLSFVYPRKRFSVALYQAGLAKIGNVFGSSSVTAGAITDGSIEVATVGLAGAYRWTDKLSVGLGVSRFQGTFASTSQLFFFDGPDLVETRILTAATADGNDFGLTAGFLWHFHRHFRFGGFFRQGPDFRLTTTVFAGEPSPLPPGTVLVVDPAAPLDLADVFGLGVAYRSKSGVVAASFEWDHVGSSGALSDADELHLGVEFAVLKTSPVLALRLGVWQDPDRLGRGAGDGPVLRPFLPVGDDETHFAAGVGFAFRRLQIDVAFDHSNRVGTGSFSTVYSF